MSCREYRRLGILLGAVMISACGQSPDRGAAGEGSLSGAAAGRAHCPRCWNWQRESLVIVLLASSQHNK